MAYVGKIPLLVQDGMTGRASLTSGAVLVGADTSPITQLTLGNDGQLLQGVTGADPTWTTSLDGNFTFVVSSSGQVVRVNVSNTDNTSSSSQGVLQTIVGGASAGPTRYQFVIPSGNNYALGILNSTTMPEADPFQQVSGTTPGSVTNISYQQSGLINYPRTSCFFLYMFSSVFNQTGAGATYTLGTSASAALTSLYNQHVDITTAGVYTAPITSVLDLRSSIQIGGAASSKVFTISLITSNRTYQYLLNSFSLSGNQTISISTLADMDVGDTAIVTCVVTGEVTDTDDIIGSSLVTSFVTGKIAA